MIPDNFQSLFKAPSSTRVLAGIWILALGLFLLNFLHPLDSILTVTKIDPPFYGKLFWADANALRLVAAAHLAAFITLFAVAPAVVAIVAERANEKIHVPLYRQVVFEEIKPLNSAILAGTGVTISLGTILLPGVLLSALQSTTLLLLIGLILSQISRAINIQFETSEQLAQRIIISVSKELDDASEQDRKVHQNFVDFRKSVEEALSASQLFAHRQTSSYLRYTLQFDNPGIAKRFETLDSMALVQRLTLLVSKINHHVQINLNANASNHVCKTYLPHEHDYLYYGDRLIMLYLDVPLPHDSGTIQDWINEEQKNLLSFMKIEPDKKAALFERFEQTFQKLYETIADNSLSSLKMYLHVFRGLFPPLEDTRNASDK